VEWKSLLFIATRLKWQLGQTARAGATITRGKTEKLEGKCKKNWLGLFPIYLLAPSHFFSLFPLPDQFAWLCPQFIVDSGYLSFLKRTETHFGQKRVLATGQTIEY